MSNAELILKECDSNEIPSDYSIYGFPISESWDMGIEAQDLMIYQQMDVHGIIEKHLLIG